MISATTISPTLTVPDSSWPSPADALAALQSFRDGLASKYNSWPLVVDGSTGASGFYGMGWDEGNKVVSIPTGTFTTINNAANVAGSSYTLFSLPLATQQKYAASGGVYHTQLGTVAEVRAQTDQMINMLQAQLNPLLAPGSIPQTASTSRNRKLLVAGGVALGLTALIGTLLYRTYRS